MRAKLWHRLAGVGALIAVSMGLAGCAAGNTAAAAGTDYINVAGQSDNLTQVFNPFLPVSAYSVSGNNTWIYEPLVQINTVKIGDDEPWLAQSWDWSDNYERLTFHLRHGVQFTDGYPFTSADVVFTYTMVKNNPALNTTGVDFKTVSAPDEYTVVFTFDSPSEPFFSQLMIPIVPEHIWSKVSNPTSYTDPKPVGTGPFMLDTFSPQSYVLKKNPHYWQSGKPQIDGVRFIAYKDSESEVNALVSGDVDWANTYIPNVQKAYLSRSSDNHYWAPDVGVDGLIPNLEKWPLSDVKVREAVSDAIDRDAVAKATDSHPATNQIGLPMPAYSAEVAPPYDSLTFTYDPAKSKQILESDGFTMGSNGYYYKDGKELSFAIVFPSSYTDITARAQVMIDNLKQIGVHAYIQGTSTSDINNITSTGDFQATIGYPIAVPPNAYLYYSNLFNPKYYVPTGTADQTWQDMERFQSPEAEKLFDEYPSATTDAQRQQIMAGLEKIFVEELPFIPIFYWGYYGDWSTARFTGFPDASNPYTQPGPSPVAAINLVLK